ncbi:hypothetical protein [Ruegeria sp. ANG-S4]|uniref:hypothetical protein n=1 Tax=Ruegeria sp. ANG-S4 TaxID=1577904 RepID=UPI00187C8ED2|nr:hypothetical protein [Ruegeria sp. ANG-S4]
MTVRVSAEVASSNVEVAAVLSARGAALMVIAFDPAVPIAAAAGPAARSKDVWRVGRGVHQSAPTSAPRALTVPAAAFATRAANANGRRRISTHRHQPPVTMD